MNTRDIVIRLAVVVLLDASISLLSERSRTFDICCSEAGDCPDGLACRSDSSCGPDARGYCEAID
jgi:hypothetical protein